MKLVIEYSHTKRVINGAFNMCASAKDLERIKLAIDRALAKEHTYGWIEVLDNDQETIANTQPKPWDE